MQYNGIKTLCVQVNIQSYKMYELNSLATALDMQKKLAERAHEIHSGVTVRMRKYHDAEVNTTMHHTLRFSRPLFLIQSFFFT